ncbi:MAG: chromosome segregation protein SMC [Candidatus Solincola sediminis]|uniref:Chromosome partition protein Smc n=1 Tax=Candidatus Solincola sediminis TaxID=1797199 RepID=A0A1F2WFU4_9ACTN|nr:MAG: chromosome segregation protein SMC [Candidatus Solincola sediminis]
MYLKSLTVRGFKSFAEKMTIEFEPGISVIVGPNGSGKSNVADSVLWVLGEQSPRNLRGTKMEDVIFAGSATRQPQSMAEVSLSFDNRNGDIPLDFPEVVVTRRILRTGESEYLLNKANCRLIDIQEILSDFGIGRELTAVISQNKLETILRSQAEDRRAFIEEAAGLRKHRRRKEKALRKMEGMERNLVRVKDIISEVNKQLRPLERQARQAKEYQELATSIRELAIRLLVAELEELKEQWENRREEEERLAHQLEETSVAVRQGKERISKLEGGIRNGREELEKCRLRQMRLLSLGERLRACQRLGEERLKLYAALDGDIGYGEDGWVSRKQELARKRAELESEYTKTEELMSELEEEGQRLRHERKVLAAELSSARRERDALRHSWDDMKARDKAIQEDKRNNLEKAEELNRAAGAFQSRRDELSKRFEEVSASLRETELALSNMMREKADRQSRLAAKKQELSRLRAELEAITERQKSFYQDSALVTARLKALEELFSSRIDFAAGASKVLEDMQGTTGIIGILLEKINMTAGWEKALESYLGPWLFCVITEGLKEALEAIKTLKKGEEGYALFLPLSEISKEPGEDLKGMARRAGGTAALDIIDCDNEILPAVEYLLGEVVFCGNIEEAGRQAELYPKLTFVTPQGDIIAPRRMIKGGAKPDSAFHVISGKREIKQLQEKLALCDEQAIAIETERSQTLEFIAGLESEIRIMEKDAEEIEAASRELEAASREKARDRERMESDIAGLTEKHAELDEEQRNLIANSAALEEEESNLAMTLERLEPQWAREEGVVEGLRQREKELDEALQQMRAKEASLSERRFHLHERLKELEEESAPVLPGREDLAEMSAAQERMLELTRRLVRSHEGLAAKAGSREIEAREGIEKGECELDELRIRLEGMESAEVELRETVHNKDLITAQLKMRVDMLVQRLLDEYRLPLETAVREYAPTCSREEMRQDLERMERRREMLGQVNLRAVEEFQALKERHDFLREQVEELKESKASLLKVVRAIDQEIVRIFKETFEEVNQHFQELFAKLFPQGRAELGLSDPTDLLNTGVDIEAQPRGKRLKKLSLLSGGETALTSLAFLFAIFKTRPSPFYFLDEVEAALDDVNLHRFLNMLKEFKGDSQLVIITHQKRTMEIADVLYGVSMQASGISKVVSQRLDEAERLARTGTD